MQDASTPQEVAVTLADGTTLPGCRPDLLNIGDLMGRGWSIIPLKARSKQPAVRWQEYQHRHPTVDELEQWFTKPGFNVGVVTGGLSRVFVIDCDSPDACAWAVEHLPACELRVRTAKGVHLYYEYSGDAPMRNRVRVKYDGRPLDIDVRASGSYVVGPGSVHPSGHVYVREGAGWTWR